MDDRADRLAGILERAHEVHAVVAERTDGADPDWALFYAWWLLNWSDFRTCSAAGHRSRSSRWS